MGGTKVWPRLGEGGERRHARRVRVSRLLGLSLAGGWRSC